MPRRPFPFLVLPLVAGFLLFSSCDSAGDDLMGFTLFNDDDESTDIVGPDESPDEDTLVPPGGSRGLELPVEDGQMLEFRAEKQGREVGFTVCEVNQANLFPAIVRWDGNEIECFSGAASG
ncbi:MAG: hypothetical protein AAF791_08690 [Bacteroidota bacterium]